VVTRNVELVDELEARLAAAKAKAARTGARVVVYRGATEAAIVWPDGKIDIQTSGAELISARAPR
jgi:hypothetical protein